MQCVVIAHNMKLLYLLQHFQLLLLQGMTPPGAFDQKKKKTHSTLEHEGTASPITIMVEGQFSERI